MQTLTITMYPTLNAISNPGVLSDILKQVKRMIIENIDSVLEDIGERLLEMAEENAANGYSGLPYPDDETTSWVPRSELTKKMYELRNKSVYSRRVSTTGMDTGYHRLINSLKRFGEGNIFEKIGRSVIVGTNFKFAKLLEHGGFAFSSHVGFNTDGTPKRWLVKIYMEEVGVPQDVKDPDYHRLMRIVDAKIEELWDELKHPRYVPARPFLKPALWFMRDKGKHIEIAINTLEGDIKIDLSLNHIRVEKER